MGWQLRREMLDHVIPLNERHLRRLGYDYVAYYHEDRTHVGLEMQTPARHPIEPRPTESHKPLCRLESVVFTIDIPGQ